MAIKLNLKVQFLGYFETWEISPENIVENAYVYEWGLRLYDTITGEGIGGATIEMEWKQAAPGEPLPPDFVYFSSFYLDADGTRAVTQPFYPSATVEGWRVVVRAYAPQHVVYSDEVAFTVGKAVLAPWLKSAVVLGVPAAILLYLGISKKITVKSLT